MTAEGDGGKPVRPSMAGSAVSDGFDHHQPLTR